MSWTTGNSEHLIRSEVWSRELKEILEDDLKAMGYVKWMSEFPDGDTFTIPSVGQAVVRDYTEDTGIKYDAMDTGEFQFTINEYLSSATYITDKAKQDMYYYNELVSSFVPKQRRAIEEAIETHIWATANAGQTAADLNAINGVGHRWVTQGADQVIQVDDFAKAKYSLNKANVPLVNLVAIVDPSSAYHIETKENITNVSNNPQWEGLIGTGITTGMRFVKNIYGFDIYESNYLPAITSETINGTAAASGVANLFFSAQPDVLPLIGAWRQMPRVESERNKDFQRDEYVTTCRYDTALYRPENLCVCITEPGTIVS
jgi:hypothetical protein